MEREDILSMSITGRWSKFSKHRMYLMGMADGQEYDKFHSGKQDKAGNDLQKDQPQP